jgi:hypothetical protein
MAYVYLHKRADNNTVFYVGIANGIKYKRANEKARRSNLWKNIVSKYNYFIEIYRDDLSYEQAKEIETQLIKKYGRIDLKTGTLANMTAGGDGTLNKIFTDEYRQKLSTAAKKRDNTLAYKKMIEARLLYKPTESHKKAISNKLKGVLKSEYVRQLSSERMIKNNPSKNRLGKNSINYKFDVLCYKDGDLLSKYNGVHDAARSLNLSPTKISAVLNGRRNKTGGYVFKKDQLL